MARLADVDFIKDFSELELLDHELHDTEHAVIFKISDGEGEIDPERLAGWLAQVVAEKDVSLSGVERQLPPGFG